MQCKHHNLFWVPVACSHLASFSLLWIWKCIKRPRGKISPNIVKMYCWNSLCVWHGVWIELSPRVLEILIRLFARTRTHTDTFYFPKPKAAIIDSAVWGGNLCKEIYFFDQILCQHCICPLKLKQSQNALEQSQLNGLVKQKISLLKWAPSVHPNEVYKFTFSLLFSYSEIYFT